MARVKCPSCRSELQLPGGVFAARLIECPSCNRAFPIPHQGDEEASLPQVPLFRPSEDTRRKSSAPSSPQDDRPQWRHRRADDDTGRPVKDYSLLGGHSRLDEAEAALEYVMFMAISGFVLMLCCPLMGIGLGFYVRQQGQTANELSNGKLGGVYIAMGWVIIVGSILNSLAGAALMVSNKK